MLPALTDDGYRVSGVFAVGTGCPVYLNLGMGNQAFLKGVFLVFWGFFLELKDSKSIEIVCPLIGSNQFKPDTLYVWVCSWAGGTTSVSLDEV